MKKLILLLCLPMIGFGQQTFNFMHNGLNREYIYYAPANLSVDAPLVFVAHGFTGSAQGIMSYCGMNTVADQNSFAVCYPQGTIDYNGDNFWNVGYDFHAGVNVDDVDFIVSLASYLQSIYQLSTINTFFTGMSNGGELCYLLACETSGVFRAFAPVAGTVFPNGLTNNICSPGVPVPMFETHGRNDNVTLIEGDPFDQYWGPYLATDTIINFWVDQHSLTDLVIDTFPNLNNNNKITISYKYSDPATNNEVWLYTHKNGHNWVLDGDVVIEEEIWGFFSQMAFTPDGLCDSININNISLNTSVNPNLISFDVQVLGYGPSVGYPGFVLFNSMGDTIGYENSNTAGNVFALMSNAIETRYLDVVQNFSLPFNGFIHLVDGWFAGNGTTECIFPFSISVTGSEEMDDTKILLKINDLLGREIIENTTQNNHPLFYIYDDGTVDKKIIIE